MTCKKGWAAVWSEASCCGPGTSKQKGGLLQQHQNRILYSVFITQAKLQLQTFGTSKVLDRGAYIEAVMGLVQKLSARLTLNAGKKGIELNVLW